MKTPNIDVVGLGLNATDVAIEVPAYPAFNTKVEISSACWQAGGQVATAMVVCRRLGLRASYIGRFGSDPLGDFQRESLATEGINIEHSRAVEDCQNQTAYIVIDQQTGERTILWQRDPRLAIQPEELRPEMVTGARALHVDGHDCPAAAQAARWAQEAGLPVTADVDNIYPGLDALLAEVDYLISSSTFPAAYTGEADLFKALEMVQENFGIKLIAASLGADGVLAREKGKFLYLPGYQVNCRDTTGAGDVFHGAFVFGLLEGWPTEQILDFSNAMAALSCEGLGARGGIRTRADAEALMTKGESRPPRWPELVPKSKPSKAAK
jgi:sulfofructose kinase